MNEDPEDKVTEGQSSGVGKSPLEYALRKKGADEEFIAQRLINMTGAKRKQWNNVTKSFEIFEDYKVQLAAIEQIVRVLGLCPTQLELEERYKPDFSFSL